MKAVIIVNMLLLVNSSLFGQYENTFSAITKTSFLKPMDFSLNIYRSDTITIGGAISTVPYSYLLVGKDVRIEYVYSKQSELDDSSCGHFLINGQKYLLKGKFESDFACDIDVYSLKLFSGKFKNQQYMLVKGNSNGSGSSTTSVICFLFDISNKKNITYYPLWSKYGSENCFQDFNGDGHLDFLRIRNLNLSSSSKDLKIDIMSLITGKFRPFEEGKRFIIGEYNGNSFLIKKKRWF